MINRIVAAPLRCRCESECRQRRPSRCQLVDLLASRSTSAMGSAHASALPLQITAFTTVPATSTTAAVVAATTTTSAVCANCVTIGDVAMPDVAGKPALRATGLTGRS